MTLLSAVVNLQLVNLRVFSGRVFCQKLTTIVGTGLLGVTWTSNRVKGGGQMFSPRVKFALVAVASVVVAAAIGGLPWGP
jgi:hypothetical protein